MSTGFLKADERPRPLSKAEFSRVLSYYKNLKTLDVDFAQKKRLVSIGTEIDARGHLRLERNPSKVIWDISNPSRLRVILAPNEMRMISDYGTSRAKTSIFAKDSVMNQQAKNIQALTAWLNLDTDYLYSNYRIFSKGEGVYEFKPKETDKSPFRKLEMKTAVGGHVQHLKLEERSRDVIELSFALPMIVRAKP